MADLHVVSLSYSLSTDRVNYINPQPVAFEREAARFTLADGKLTCEMKLHFQSAGAARAVIELILRDWEADAGLYNPGALGFKFEEAHVIDRSPAPPGVIRGHGDVLFGAVTTSGQGPVSPHVSRTSYPEPPPSTFRLNPDAESILQRYQGYLAGREPLLSMAYFCLTVPETVAVRASTARPRGISRKKIRKRVLAARDYQIDIDVLEKIGELTAERGDHSSARKASAGPMKALTGPENAWLEAAVKMLIRRVGDTRDASALPLITLDDLPKL